MQRIKSHFSKYKDVGDEGYSRRVTHTVAGLRGHAGAKGNRSWRPPATHFHGSWPARRVHSANRWNPRNRQFKWANILSLSEWPLPMSIHGLAGLFQGNPPRRAEWMMLTVHYLYMIITREKILLIILVECMYMYIYIHIHIVVRICFSSPSKRKREYLEIFEWHKELEISYMCPTDKSWEERDIPHVHQAWSREVREKQRKKKRESSDTGIS